MRKEEIILAALAASDGAIHTPVQIQKLLFLIDKKIPDLIKGPYFSFIAYAYGPFDKEIYSLLEKLEQEEHLEIIRTPYSRWPTYRLTLKGQNIGQNLLEQMGEKTSNYIKSLSTFVRNLSFAALVSSIYKEYPEMKKNSVFGT